MAELFVNTETRTQADYKTAHHQMYDDISQAVVVK